MLLAVALVVSLVFVFAGEGDDSVSPPDAGATTTTTTVVEATSTTLSETPGTTSAPPGTVPPVRPGSALVAVKVDNAPGARPPVGIGAAPIVVEYAVEGEITRFAAVFPRESTGIIGPIRSLRPVDADLFPAIAPVIVSSGGQPFVLQDVAAAGVRSIEAGDSSMFVSLGRQAPHDTFVDMELLGQIVDDSVLPVGGGLPIGGALPEMTSSATEITSPLGATFGYDQELGYVRFEDGAPFEVLDLAGSNPEPLSHDTLIFLFAAERAAGYTDSNGVPVSTFDVIGSGDLLVFHGGEALVGTWSRSALVDPLVFQDDIGEPIRLPDGSAYLAVVSRTEEVAFR